MASIQPTTPKTAALIVNGQMTYSDKIAKRINEFSSIILVDGGANHYYQLSQRYKMRDPELITGDLDSINPHILEHYQTKNITIKKLDRAKDKTDLEEALDSQITEFAETAIFGGLGGRLDHTLGNLFMLLRYPSGRLFFETENERVFLINSAQQNSYSFEKKDFTFCSLFSFYETSFNVTLKDGDKVYFYENISIKGLHCELSKENSSVTVTVEQGQLLCVQNYGKNTLDDSVIKTFSIINDAFASQALIGDGPKSYKIITPKESFKFNTLIGETISLIPLLGDAKNIVTSGLKWELNNDALNKDFIGISNVALKDVCNIFLEEGYLFCIINSDLIDEEMVTLKDHSKTGRLTNPEKL